MNNKVHILDIGCSNTYSVSKMVEKLKGKFSIVKTTDQLLDAKKIILPGVGSYDNAISKLQNMKIVDLLYDKVINQKVPILGICLGMQLFAEGSEEGELDGLGYIHGYIRKFNFIDYDDALKIPHMGWNTIDRIKPNLIIKDLYPNTRYYFVHSYHFVAENKEDVIAETNYGYKFPSIINKNNIYGTQFHPEKSHRYGKEIISNFLNLI